MYTSESAAAVASPWLALLKLVQQPFGPAEYLLPALLIPFHPLEVSFRSLLHGLCSHPKLFVCLRRSLSGFFYVLAAFILVAPGVRQNLPLLVPKLQRFAELFPDPHPNGKRQRDNRRNEHCNPNKNCLCE